MNERWRRRLLRKIHLANNKVYRDYLARIRAGRAWPYLFLVFGCLLVLMLVVVSRTHSMLYTQAQQTTHANMERIDRLDELLLLVIDAETSVRGYLLTRSEPYLDPFLHSQARLRPLLEALDVDFPEGSADRDEYLRLKKLVDSKRDSLAGAVRSGEVAERIKERQSGRGKQMTDSIRSSIIVLKAHRSAENDLIEQKAAQLVNRVEKIMYVVALGALVLIVALFFVQQRQSALRTRIDALLEDENARLEKTVSSRTRALTSLASYLTNAREAERARLARELHDELGALLTAAKMDASWLLRSLGGTAEQGIKDRFRRLIDSIGAAITIKRRIIDDLRPPLLQGLGLVEALRALADSFSVDIPVQTQLPESDPNPTEDQSLALFRIAQESLTNIRKYARATHVQLGLEVIGSEIVIWVADDGVGFDPKMAGITRHGLAGMQHRVQMFDGIFSLDSMPGKGTRVEARMPLHVRSGIEAGV